MADASIGTSYLQVIPKLDTSTLGGESAKAGKAAGDGVASGLSSKSVALGNIMSSALMKAASAAGNAVTSVIGDAFSGFADYEQLVGGVEKIFDQANIGAIMDDANRAFSELNMSANDYLRAINQTGASFAQTMGDQKGYDVARKGMLAISDYASGTGRSIEDLNNKFALITRSTSSYQSIADQFSGILPATSADFLAQAQAAGLLSREYTKLTDVPVAEYQQAVSSMLEKGVADMGLAGNTLAESTSTISGSLAMLSSSWQNFLTGLFDENADLGKLTEQLFSSLGAVAKNVLPRVAALVQSLFVKIPEVLGKMIADLPNALGPMLDQVLGSEMGGKVTGHIQAVVDFLMNDVAPFVQRFIDTLTPIIQKIGEVVATVLPYIGMIIQTVFQGISAVTEVTWPIIETIVTTVLDVIKGAIEGIATVVGVVADTFNAIKEAITNPIETAKNVIKGIVDAIKGFFSFKIEFPHIPLPHFVVNPPGWQLGDLLKGQLPSLGIEWYAKGGIVDGPTLIGAGEAGPEAIVPLTAPNLAPFAEAFVSAMGGNRGGIYIEHMDVHAEDVDGLIMSINRRLVELGAM